MRIQAASSPRAAAVLGLLATLVLLAAEPTAAATSTTLQKRMLDCTIESKSLNDCDAGAYAIRLGVFAAPGIFMFMLLWLCCPFYCGGKYCCNCCGGRSQTPNCCCPADKYPARYSTGDLIRPRVYGVIAMFMVAGSLGWGFTGIFELIDGLEGLRVVIEDVPNALQGRIDQIETALIVRTYSSSTQAFSQTNLFASTGLGTSAAALRDELKGAIDQLMVTYREYVGYLIQAIIAVFAVPAAVILIGQIASLCSCRSILPMLVVWCLFIFGGLLWFSHGLFSGLSMAIGDVCAEVDGMVNQQTNVLPVVLGCEDSLFDDFRNSFRSVEAAQAAATCSTLMGRCYDSSRTVAQNLAAGDFYVCPPAATTDCAQQTFGTLLTISESFWYIHPDISNTPGARQSGYTCTTTSPCTMEVCSRECVDSSGALSTTGHASKEAYYNFLAVNQVSNAIDTVGAQYSNCDAVMLIVMGPANAPCGKLTSGLVFARQASGLEGLAIVIGLFVFVWGAKRFMSLDAAGKPQMDGRDPHTKQDD